MSEIEKKWYVLRAISGKETKVKEYLEADIKNSDLGDYVSQVLIPTEKVYQVRNGKKIVDVYKRQVSMLSRPMPTPIIRPLHSFSSPGG